MIKPRQRFAELGNFLALAAGLIILISSSTMIFFERMSDLSVWLTWSSSIILLSAIIIPYLSAAQTSQPIQDGEQNQTDFFEHCTDLLNAINHGVVVVDPDCVITFANNAFYRWVAGDGPLIGRSISEVFLDAHSIQPLSFSYRLAHLALESDQEQSATLNLPYGNNRFYHMHITATPVRNRAGSSTGVLLLYQDRTPERELHETIRRHDQLETVSQMAASIAHEVRNPMTSVQGFLQLMSREVDPAHAHSMYLHVMEEDLKRINSIITEYLNFSRMGSDSLEDVWVGTLVHNTYTLLQSEANLKGIQIVLSLLGNNPLLIANPNRLKQVLINLSRNAMEAMSERGGGVLTLSLDTTDDQICLTVRDTGPGIPEDVYPQIFRPFYTTKSTGTGLGLFISKQIIEEHNGTIEVETSPNAGTAFHIRLPKNRLFENQ